jgi:hypothetical protein
MSYIACSGVWSQGSGGEILCDVTATLISESELAASLLSNNQLSAEDFGIYFGSTVMIFVIAYGIKLTRRLFEDQAGRRG